MMALKFEFANLNALGAQKKGAQKKTKKGEQIVPKSYSKSNISKELLQLAHTPIESPVY